MSLAKRGISLFMCCAIVFASCFSLRANAIVAALPALAAESPAVASFLANLLVTAGLSAGSSAVLSATVDDVWAALPTDTQTGLVTATAGGSIVIDPTTGSYKYVSIVPDDLWQFVKSAVGSLFNEGDNSLYSYDSVALDNYAGLPSYSLYTSGVSSQLPLHITYLYQGSIYTQNMWFDGDIFHFTENGSNVAILTDVNTVTMHSDSVNMYIVIDYSDQHSTLNSTYPLSWLTSFSYLNPTLLGDITGASGTVDNTEYDWSNTSVDAKAIVLNPELSADGSIALDDAGNVVVDYTKTAEGLIDLTYEDLAGIDATGIPVSTTDTSSTITDEATTDYTAQPEAGTESNTSLKALMFSKFPFCLPWDIKNAFSLLLATPTAPHWTVDIFESVRSKFGITGNTTIDINMDDFEVVGTVCRWTSTISFCIALIVLTRKIIRS